MTPARADPSFWSGRRVFLTGHTGFKGSWMMLWLRSMGAEVTGYALAPDTPANAFQALGLDQAPHGHIADVRDGHTLRQCMLAAQPQTVIHMAAQPLVRRSYVEPVLTYETNVMGTVHLLEAVRACDSVSTVLVVTSDKCYENREWHWGYRESDPMGGYDPYSNSKGCAELVCAAWRSSYFTRSRPGARAVELATARSGNVIGGGDWSADRLVPDLLRAMQSGTPALIRNPAALRPWQHVLEPLNGYLLLAEALERDGGRYARAWNFGPSDEDTQPVSWLADALAQAWGDGARWVTDGAEHPHEATYLKLDCSAARAELGWAPRWRLSRAVHAIVDWHRAHARGENMRTFSLSQIEQFLTDSDS